MILYVNGDSNSAGAEILKDYCFAGDDPTICDTDRRPHPELIHKTYGAKLAKYLNATLVLEAESASSNARILRTTRNFLENTKAKPFIVIGWTTWDREEWSYKEEWLQVTASGTDSVPEELKQKYKQWVIDQTPEEVRNKRLYWTNLINQFSNELNQQHIKHLFFHIDEYTKYLTKQGCKTVNNGYHFGEDGHDAWCNFLLERLTSTQEHSTIKTN